MEIKIEKLAATDIDKFIELIRLFEDVFEMKDFKIPPKEHLQKVLADEDFFVFVAFSGNTMVGGLTTFTLQQYYSVLPLVYIYDLAVKRECQRQGVGKKLIASLNAYCKENGFQEVFVQADRVDDYALDFYRSTGAREEDVIHFTYALNENQE